MMVTVTFPWWWLAVGGVLAVAGLCAVLVAAADLLGRARDWGAARWYRRRRGQPQGISDDCWFGAHEDCDGCECAGCGHDGPPDPLLELPPERTWEQMTSHQLPAAGPSRKIREWLERDDPAEDDGPDGCVVPSSPESASAALAMRTGIGTLSAQRERRAPWWEAEQRQAYAALGLEFPSGLMARVREAAQ